MKRFDHVQYAVKRVLLFCIVGSLGAILLSGCPAASSSSKMTTKEEANFKGGPMPADFKPNVGSGPPKSVPPK